MNRHFETHPHSPQQFNFPPVQNPFQSRPFAIQAKPEQSSSQQTENSEGKEKPEKPKKAGYTLANISINPPQKSPQSTLQRQLTLCEPENKHEQRTIPKDVQAKMEKAFNTDFSQVKIQQGNQASSIGALAYTQGNNIYFAQGQYQPNTQAGQKLLGHELTHVVQQRQGRVKPTVQAKGLLLNNDAKLEKEADELGEKASRGEQVNVHRITTTSLTGHQVGQCKNQIKGSPTYTMKDHPLSVLEKEFGPYYAATGNIPDFPIHKGKYIKPNQFYKQGAKLARVTQIEAELDGIRPDNQARSDGPMVAAYGHLGEHERAIFGRAATATYEGGHLISNEILGNDSNFDENFAPQLSSFNSPGYRLIEELAHEGPVDKTTGTTSKQPWGMKVILKYDSDYQIPVASLAGRIIPSMVTQGYVTKKNYIEIPRRVPSEWHANIWTNDSKAVFPEKNITTRTAALQSLVGDTSEVSKRAKLTRRLSQEHILGIDSANAINTGSTKQVFIAGKSKDTFVADQAIPMLPAQQPHHTGGTVVTAPAVLNSFARPSKFSGKIKVRQLGFGSGLARDIVLDQLETGLTKKQFTKGLQDRLIEAVEHRLGIEPGTWTMDDWHNTLKRAAQDSLGRRKNRPKLGRHPKMALTTLKHDPNIDLS